MTRCEFYFLIPVFAEIDGGFPIWRERHSFILNFFWLNTSNQCKLKCEIFAKWDTLSSHKIAHIFSILRAVYYLSPHGIHHFVPVEIFIETLLPPFILPSSFELSLVFPSFSAPLSNHQHLFTISRIDHFQRSLTTHLLIRFHSIFHHPIWEAILTNIHIVIRLIFILLPRHH